MIDEEPKRVLRCYQDTKHDGDPICFKCAVDLYGKPPKNKYKFPRNCWSCEQMEPDSNIPEPYYGI